MPGRRPTLKCPAPDDRFWTKVDKSGPGDCWLWTGNICSDTGYGRFHYRGRNVKAHRISYVATYGEHDPELVIDHLCRVRHCVNPDHMEVVTVGENTNRGCGPLANKARAQECPQGHPYTPENTYSSPTHRRMCRTCKRRNSKSHKARVRQRRLAEFGAATGRPPKEVQTTNR